jgi:hypothetical protein
MSLRVLNQRASFEAPPASKTYHIIWNLLLCDKQTPLTQDLIDSEGICHIVAILPEQSDYDALAKDVKEVPSTVLAYYDVHEPIINKYEFDNVCNIINGLAKERINSVKRNVLVFCNNGCQRSIPFLTYYLTKFHPDEVPTIESAVDKILPQIDREGYAEKR